MFSGGMWIFYLESALALGMFVFIVWWTLPKKPRGQEQAGEDKNTTSRSRDAGATPGAGQAKQPDKPDNAGKPQEPHR